MKTQYLGPTEIQVTRLCYGAMRLSHGWDRNKVTAEQIDAGIKCLEAAVDTGCNFIDHADIYCAGMCEEIYGRAVKRHPEWRDKLVVATKCGIRWEAEPAGAPHRYDFSRQHILWSIDESLKRLNLDRVDLYQLHRPDWLADPDEIAEAFSSIHQAGKVRYFGVSNFRPSLVAAVQSRLPFPLVVNQVEIHFLRLDCFEDGTLDQCLENRMTPLAWSPLAGGRLGAALDDSRPLPEAERDVAAVARLKPVLRDVANAYNTTPLAILLAWQMRHPSKIIPIFGSIRPELIKQAAHAAEIELDRESWYHILRAARGRKLA
ncbi:MAG TPA: aldo/keto reductase [Candidatus Methylacidiphilales bacterium]|jgi:predicted oxidoreductase|nr:aldo/keto reductase [Candidatus Methylacidiphilales bacterium]